MLGSLRFLRKSKISQRTCTLGSCRSIKKGKRNPSWCCCLPATRHGHACKQDNTINGKLLKAQKCQRNKNPLVPRNILHLSCYLIQLKFCPVFSQARRDFTFVASMLKLGLFSSLSDPSVSSADSSPIEASLSALFSFTVYLLPANLLFLLLPLLKFFFGGICSICLTGEILKMATQKLCSCLKDSMLRVFTMKCPISLTQAPTGIELLLQAFFLDFIPFLFQK